jgi:hypothetical protein
VDTEFVASMVLGALLSGASDLDGAAKEYAKFLANNIAKAYIDVFTAVKGRPPMACDSASLFALLIAISNSRGITRCMTRDALRYHRLVQAAVSPRRASDWPMAIRPVAANGAKQSH